MVVGDVKYGQISDRVGVIAEPSQLAKLKYDQKEVPQYLQAAESYLTPLPWDSFVLVVLPGLMTEEVSGMENPYLTIVQSVKPDLVIHELAHSWFGNQVTCNSWPSFWLNEAFAVFVERKVAKKFLGDTEFNDEVK